MCLGVPGKVEEIFHRDGVKMAIVDFGGVKREVCVETIDDLKEGDYVIVHVGFAISKLNEEEAERTAQLLNIVL